MPGVVRPMLATAGELPLGPGWAYELKWDGVRAVAVVSEGRTRLYARSGTQVTAAYPELQGLVGALAAQHITDVVLDGEIVVLDAHGVPSFSALAERMHVRDVGRARQLAAAHPVTYMIFDVIRVGETDFSALPYAQRREWLQALGAGFERQAGAGAPTHWAVPPHFGDGPATLSAAQELGLEGVVAKRMSSRYRPGVRSPDWIKVKRELTGDFVVGGWRPGQRELGALLVGTPVPDGLRYRGRVGGGISVAAERDLLKRLGPLRRDTSPFTEPLPRDDARGAIYTEPIIVVEVRYGSLTAEGRLRFPRFVRLRLDKSPKEAVDA